MGSRDVHGVQSKFYRTNATRMFGQRELLQRFDSLMSISEQYGSPCRPKLDLGIVICEELADDF